MDVLILGAGGFIGQAIARASMSRGWRTLGVTRSGGLSVDERLDWVQGSRADAGFMRALVSEQSPDIIVDMVAYTPGETTSLLEALEDWAGRYVLISSADVYREYGRLTRRETGPPAAQPMDEDAPLRVSRHPYRSENARREDDPCRWMDDYDKISVEMILRVMRSNWTICRLPMVYGPEDKQQRFAWAYGPMRAGAERIELPGQWLDWTATYGFVDNVAAGIVHAAGHALARDLVVNLTDEGAPVSHAVWLDRFATCIGWTGEIVRSDDPGHPIAQATAGLDLSVDLRVSGERFQSLTGFAPPICLEEAVSRTIATPV